eukprot:GILK01007361.1.p1 GENE.GILK01007361.1~~GILK01007361.1.p1  ORF type:complete len:792 (+),score=140.99 GILK01007361.1:243-2378(+)
MSAVTDVSFSADGRNLISAGRDQVVCVWNLKDFSSTPVPTYETVEAVISIPSSMDTHGYPKNQKNRPELFVTAGDKGVLRIWNAALRTCVWEQKNKLTAVNIRNAADTSTTAHTITHLLLSPVRQKILAVTSDHYIFFLDPLNLTKTKQIAGFNDDVIDLKYIPTTDSIPRSSSSRIVLATNSERVQLLDLHSSDTQALSGHSDIVLSVDVSHDGRFVATAGKDNTIRVWSLYPINAESSSESTSESTAESKRTTEQEGGRCMAVVTGHTEAVSTVAFGRKSNGFMVSGSQDKTVKLWDMNWLNKTVGASETDQDILSITVASFTQRAHDKDINAVAVAPNDKLFASGSQDKTVKIWSVAEGKLLGTLKGHRRGVWTVEFSPVDKAVLTGSGDRTIRLWSLSDFSCIKTFEGHTNTVLKVAFLPMGMQLVSCGSDGLVKLWTIKTNECVATFEKHDDRIWALAVSTDGKQMITGGADSVLNIWKDITEEEWRLRVGRRYTLGRCRKRSDLVVDDESVSREHAELVVFDDGTGMCTDLDSSKGTKVDGRDIGRYKKCKITPESVMLFGGCSLEFRLIEEPKGDPVVEPTRTMESVVHGKAAESATRPSSIQKLPAAVHLATSTVAQKRKLLWSKESKPSAQWEQTSFNDERTKDKFLHLMGAKKAKTDTHNSEDSSESRALPDSTQLVEDLEKQFMVGLKRKDGRTVGLGFS